MRNRLTLLVGIVVLLVLLAYMFAFQVRYDQVAVRTTFENATEQSIKKKPGLYPRLPWPIQKVHTYDKRVRVLEDQLEQLQTADAQNVIVRTYTAWKIEDPLKFFQKLKTSARAREALLPIVRDTREVISEYSFDQLVNTSDAEMKLAEVEQAALKQLRQQLKSHGYGIKVRDFGIRRVVLPEQVTEQVFEQMRRTRERLAANTKASGKAEAARIKSQAESIRERIMAFAERRASQIRAEGDRAAAQHYEVFEKNEAFAVFLREIEALEEMLKHNTTFVLDAKQITPLDLFATSPEELAEKNPEHPLKERAAQRDGPKEAREALQQSGGEGASDASVPAAGKGKAQ